MSDSLSSRKLRLRPFPTEFSGIPAYNPFIRIPHKVIDLDALVAGLELG
jgi:hypothetical protein